MAAARGHVDVAERRLRPIYDCLDNGNNKKAIHEVEKVLKKQKDFWCAKALKALALLRLGRCDESSAILHEVHAQHPADESTLQAMAMCYREMHDLELMADMYENAHKVKPDNEEILSSLFMAHVRLGNFKKQQQTAMAMHRLRPDKNPYYFWAVMSIVMQAETADEKLAKTMFLPLAERMSQKYEKDGKIEAEAEVQLYLMILTMMGKHEAALELIQGELGKRIGTDPTFQENKEAELLSKLERWSESNKCHKKLLRKHPDQWMYYQEYLESTFAMIDSKFEPSKEDQSEGEGEADSTVESAVSFLQSQIDAAVDAGQKIRGPYLAQLELCRYLDKRNIQNPDSLGSLYGLLKDYFRKFSDKQICYDDLAGYLELLEQNEIRKLLDEFFTEVGLENTDNSTLTFAKDIKQLQRHLTVLQLSRYTGQHKTLSLEEKYKLIDELVQRHTHGLQFGEDLLTTDLQYSDNYMLLAAHLLLDIWKSTGSLKQVWQAILLLEKATKKSPSNFNVKLLLIALYAKLGACGPCCILFESMEIKHIQHDALGYVIANHLSRQGNLAAVSQLFRTMLRFFTVNHKETTEYLITSYKYGSFVKIPEFVRFRSRLQNSLQYALAGAEQLLFEITYEPTLHITAEQVIHHAEINPYSDVTVYEDICDNRDLDVSFTWDPKDQRISDEDKAYSLKEELAWLRLRNFTIRVLAASVHLSAARSSCCSNGNTTCDGSASTVTVLANLKSSLSDHLKECQMYKAPYKYKLTGPTRTGLTSYMSNKCGDIFLSAIEMVLYCNRLLENGIDKTENDKEDLMKISIVSSLKDLLDPKKCGLLTENNGEKVLQPECIEHFTTVIEVLSHILVLTGCCWRLLKQSQQGMSKKAKKKKNTASGKSEEKPVTFDSYNKLLSGLNSVCEQLQTLIGDIVPQLLSLDMDGLKIDGHFLNALHISSQSANNTTDENNVDDQALDKDRKEENGSNNTNSSKVLEKDTSQAVRTVWDKVTKSYKETAQNLNDFISNKLEYAASIKL